jgi:hypothetical protein
VRLAVAVAAVVVVGLAVAVALLRNSGDDGSVALRSGGSDPTATLVECASARNPKVGAGDALPAKGYTDEAYVRSVLLDGRQQIEAKFPGAVAVRMAPRNGEVWSYDAAGQVIIEQRTDFWIVVELGSATDCPASPSSWNGVPLQFVAP